MKLKQKIAFGLCLFYIIGIVGIVVNMHFCGGKLSSVQLTETAKCGACKGEKEFNKHNCCKNTEVKSNVDDSHEAGVKIKVPESSGMDLFLHPMLVDLVKIMLPKWFGSVDNKAPPLSSVISLHLFNCVFRN